MIERVRIDSLLHCLSPLLVRNRYIADRPPYSFAKGFDNFPDRRSFTHDGVYILGRHAGISQEGCRYARNIFRAGEWNDRRFVAPRQEGGILLGHAPADERAYIFVIRGRLKMNSPNLGPIENTIGQPMLQVSEGGSVLEIAKCGIVGRSLKLRIVHHQFQASVTSRCGEEGGCFKQPIGYRVCEESAFHALHSSQDRSRIEEVAFEDFRALCTEVIGPGIQFVDEGTNGDSLLEQIIGDEASG